MLNSPALCQYVINQPLEVVCKQFPQYIIYHYRDDTLLAASDTDILEKMFNVVQKNLHSLGLQISPEKKKTRRGNSLNYLGFKLSKQGIQSQKLLLWELL